jgi:hypothetical protein
MCILEIITTSLWLIFAPLIFFTIVKIYNRKSTSSFIDIWDFDFCVWLIMSTVFIEIYVELCYYNVLRGNFLVSLIQIPRDFLLQNYYIIFSIQFFLFFISLFRSIYTKKNWMFCSKTLLMFSAFLMFYSVSKFI